MQGFQWDEAKAASNLAKHGVGFDEAISAFLDPLALSYFDAAHSAQEDRWITIGFSEAARLLLVVSTERDAAVRVISARRATPGERQIYERHNR